MLFFHRRYLRPKQQARHPLRCLRDSINQSLIHKSRFELFAAYDQPCLVPAAANFGQSDQPFEIRGGIAVPPGYAMGLAILSGAGTTPLYGVGGRWGEMESDLEP